jgi:hypothetical protein
VSRGVATDSSRGTDDLHPRARHMAMTEAESRIAAVWYSIVSSMLPAQRYWHSAAGARGSAATEAPASCNDGLGNVRHEGCFRRPGSLRGGHSSSPQRQTRTPRNARPLLASRALSGRSKRRWADGPLPSGERRDHQRSRRRRKERNALWYFKFGTCHCEGSTDSSNVESPISWTAAPPSAEFP